jgi:hypothetical protein
MAADDLSSVNLPPLEWVSDAGAREPRRDPAQKSKDKAPDKIRNARNANSGESKPISPDIEFEKTEHELDSIA